MKKLFFTIFVVIFFSILFIVENVVKAAMKLLGYIFGAPGHYSYPENNKQQGGYQHS